MDNNILGEFKEVIKNSKNSCSGDIDMYQFEIEAGKFNKKKLSQCKLLEETFKKLYKKELSEEEREDVEKGIPEAIKEKIPYLAFYCLHINYRFWEKIDQLKELMKYGDEHFKKESWC